MARANVKFPFFPNEKVKAAFRQEIQLKRAVKLVQEAIVKAASDVIDPWEIVRKEHPELISPFKRLRYDQISESIDIIGD